MTDLTPASFIESARDFAGSALEAHIAGQFRRVALDAGTALEHLAKACLAKRSPALLTELRSEANFPSLLVLLGIASGSPPGLLRTVSLRDALARLRRLITTSASSADLETLISMRDGTVHTASTDEVETRLIVAFLQHADGLLTDLDLDREIFWGRQAGVVDALLVNASDQVTHRVEVLMAAARARFRGREVDDPQLLKLHQDLAGSLNVFDGYTAPAECPACMSWGIASGFDEISDFEDERATALFTFRAESFTCRVCGLELSSPAELEAAGMDPNVYDSVSVSVSSKRRRIAPTQTGPLAL
jgi:hypothetical protein